MKAITRVALATITIFNVLAGLAFRGQTQSDLNVRITQIDTSDFPRVTFFVSVTDAEGNPFPVDASRLVIMENGQQIPLDQIEGIGDVGPLTTMLVMDVSDSMNAAGKLDSAKAAAHQFVDRMREQDQSGLITFNTRVETAQAITSDPAALHAAIDSLQASNQTAMYDALMSAIDQLEGVEGRKAIIVLTDGLDNSSQSGAGSVIDRVGPEGFSISTIGLGVPADVLDEMTGIDEEGLQDLAARAGGVYGYANDEESLTRLFETYAVALQSEYQITYTSPATLRDGVNRSLSVALASGAGGEPAGTERYNPGGLVPEVENPAPWPLFAAVVGGLALLVALPLIIGAVRANAPASAGGRARGGGKSRVKMKERPRIKLK
jgi:VWFA-related protein